MTCCICVQCVFYSYSSLILDCVGSRRLFVVTKTTWKSFRPHRTHSMDTSYCYSRSSVVRLCVCLCVGHDREPSKNGRTDRDAVGGRTRVGPRNHMLHRAHIGATRWIRWIDLFGGGGAAVSTVAVANLLLLLLYCKKGKGSPYSITERRVPELIPVLGSQPASDVNHIPDGRLPLFSARPAVTPATLNMAATSFAAWWTEAQWVWTVCLRLLPDSVATAIWTRALLRLSSAR